MLLTRRYSPALLGLTATHRLDRWKEHRAMIRIPPLILGLLMTVSHATAYDRGEFQIAVYSDMILPTLAAPGAEWGRPRPEDRAHAEAHLRKVFADVRELGC